MSGGIQQLCHEERLGELGLLRLEKRSFGVTLFQAFRTQRSLKEKWKGNLYNDLE